VNITDTAFLNIKKPLYNYLPRNTPKHSRSMINVLENDNLKNHTKLKSRNLFITYKPINIEEEGGGGKRSTSTHNKITTGA
jgi:hypothetical protein